MGFVTNCVNSRCCLRLRRNDTIQRTTRRMDKAPNGIWASCPASVAFIAWILSLSASCLCTFIIRTVTFNTGATEQDRLDGSAGLLLRNQGIGFWGWEGDEGSCFSYEISGNAPSFDAAFYAASAFTTLTDALGGLVMVCLLLGTVFPVPPKSYEYLGYASLLMAVFDGSTLAILGSSVCSPGFFQYGLDTTENQQPSGVVLEEITTASCGLGLGSILAVIACILWVVCAFCILRTPLASRKREPGAYRQHHKEGDGEDNMGLEPGENDNDEAHQLYRQRQEENDKRYRELMGDVDDDRSMDEEGQPGFKSLRGSSQFLSLVKEEESGDDRSGHLSPARQSSNRQSDENDDDDDDFHDEHDGGGGSQHSETRSQYSDDREQQEGGQGDDAPSPQHQMLDSSRPSSTRSSTRYSDRDEEGEDLRSTASSEIV
mmetsp:Transcript_29293/g.48417  ORF Transcript_29293/g.48417 Transcript_29293/m.48417 type:complete len:431 (-) Transcript_29293:94-1386(-)|eukprot:CAMPEP_0119019270 /NCGR_PEP_ID=MMETSP1176-20130426/21400_1 /TAXON_ID=265551 /ORGANISM="Synedropsis recta cf, Strain CCMP1620" /LENGTH=430 /DNA_ID=CAMNT_0006973431 /DNA_START=60 /DNA_END=1352 /DNA_ORIENTATION=+